MMLTDKAKKYFGLWHFENGNYFEYINFHNLSDNLRNALIIEWFDSVRIYIEIRRNNNNPLNKGFHGYVIKSINGYYQCTTIPVKLRMQATIEAIKKANDIYNETI